MRRTLAWQLSARQLLVLAFLLVGSAGFQYVALRHFLVTAASRQLRAAVREPVAQYQLAVAGGTPPVTAAKELVRSVADPRTLAWVIGPDGSVWAQATAPRQLTPPVSGNPVLPAPAPPGAAPRRLAGAQTVGGDIVLETRIPTPRAGGPVTLVVATRLQDIFAILRSEVRLLLVGGLAVLAVGGLVGTLGVRQALRPLRSIRATADQIAGGNLGVRAGHTDAPEEIAHLARAFDAMVDRLAAAIEEERATHRQMRRFLDDASHELRTPLTALSGTLEVLQGKAGEDPAALQQGLRAAYRQARRLGALVSGLLSLARAERADGLPLVRTDVRDILEALRPTVERLAADHQLEWGEPEGPLPILAEPTVLGSAVLNVVENAVHYSPLGTRIRITARRDGPVAEVAISDQGPGISAEHLPHVFERFYRGHDAGAGEPSHGTGLGLAIVRSVLSQHGGEARMESSVGKGTTVSLRLPLAM